MDRFRTGKRLGHGFALRGNGLEVSGNPATHQHAFAELGHHHAARTGLGGFARRAGMGDRFIDHIEEHVAGLHRRRHGSWRLLPVGGARWHDGDGRFSADRDHRCGDRLGHLEHARLGDDDCFFSCFGSCTHLNDGARALGHQHLFHIASLLCCCLRSEVSGGAYSLPTMPDTSMRYICRACSCTESMHTCCPSRLQRGWRSQRFSFLSLGSA